MNETIKEIEDKTTYYLLKFGEFKKELDISNQITTTLELYQYNGFTIVIGDNNGLHIETLQSLYNKIEHDKEMTDKYLSELKRVLEI